MLVSSSHQIYVFSLFILLGMLCGALFDIQRFFRKKHFAGSVRTTIEDIIFTALFIAIMLGASFSVNNGEIRYYEVMGMVSGILFYAAFLSHIFLKILAFISKIIEEFFLKPLVKTARFFISPIKKIAIKTRRRFVWIKRKIKSIKNGAEKRKKIIKKRVKML